MYIFPFLHYKQPESRRCLHIDMINVSELIDYRLSGYDQGCQVGFFEANFLESGFFPRQLASENVGWLFVEIWLFPGFILCY